MGKNKPEIEAKNRIYIECFNQYHRHTSITLLVVGYESLSFLN